MWRSEEMSIAMRRTLRTPKDQRGNKPAQRAFVALRRAESNDSRGADALGHDLLRNVFQSASRRLS
jgi:hypothetical protein